MPHLLIAPPRGLQQRTDDSDDGEIKWDPLLAVTIQNNLSPEQLTVSTWHLPAKERMGGRGGQRQLSPGTEETRKALSRRDLLRGPSVGLQKGRPGRPSREDTKASLSLAE